jgi:hypothetical protein
MNRIAAALCMCLVSGGVVAQSDEVVELHKRDDQSLAGNLADQAHRGPVKLPDFSGRDRSFSAYRTRIRNGMRQGANAAGRLALIEAGCGTSCLIVFAGDVATGRIHTFPRGGEDNPSLTLKHNQRSRAVVAYWGGADSCTREVFLWHGNGFEQAERDEIRSAKTCSALLGYAPSN